MPPMTDPEFYSDPLTIALTIAVGAAISTLAFCWSDFRRLKKKYCCKNYPWCNHIHGTNVKPND